MRKILFTLIILISTVNAAFASSLETGIVKASRDFVTVVARGEGTTRQEALEQAWTDAVRIAVGMVLSSKSNLDNDELSENIITHSRGVIENFDILQEDKNGSKTTIYIQARVHREILRDEANKYSEAQVVKADTGRAVKAQMDDTAKDTTKSNKTATGVALLKEVFDSYDPEDFFSATLDPKIHYDKNTKKPYIQINEKFNQDLFWKEFLPRVRQALEGIALKKEKKFYSKEVRQANQQLPKVGYALDISGWTDGRNQANAPYRADIAQEQVSVQTGPETQFRSGYETFYVLQAIIPDDNASYTVYYLPSYNTWESYSFYRGLNHDGFKFIRESNMQNLNDEEGILSLWLKFVEKMSSYVTFSITYIDSDGETISVQPIGTGPRCFCVYRSFSLYNNIMIYVRDHSDIHTNMMNIMYLVPGYIRVATLNNSIVNNLFLGTANYDKKYGGRYEIELDANELQQLDSMKFEIIYN